LSDLSMITLHPLTTYGRFKTSSYGRQVYSNRQKKWRKL